MSINSSQLDNWDSKPRRLVLAAAFFTAGTAFIVYRLDFTLLLILASALLGLRVCGVPKKYLVCVLISAALGTTNAVLRAPTPPSGDISRDCGRLRSVAGTVKETKGSAGSKHYYLNIECQANSGRLQIIATNKDKSALPIKQGDIIAVYGRISSYKSIKPDSRKLELERKGIFSIIRVPLSRVHLLRHGQDSTGEEDLISSARKKIIATHINAIGQTDGALLSSMVLGDRAVSLDEETVGKFRAAGLSHILAASGFNLTLVSATVYFLLRPLLLSNLMSSILCFLGMLAFVLLAGPSPSVIRAFVMCSLVLSSRCLERTLHMPAALSATMFLVLILDPWSISDLGFQLSYLSTAGMILCAGKLQTLLKEKYPNLPAWAEGIIAATLAAQAYVLPLQILCFREITPYCLPANMVVLPLIPLVSVLGFVASALILLETLFRGSCALPIFLDQVAAIPLRLAEGLVTWIAGLPFAQIKTAQVSPLAAIFCFLVLSVFPVLWGQNQFRLWLLLYFLALLSAIAPGLPVS